jgi:hypothetical protein
MARVALEAIRGAKTVAKIAAHHPLRPTPVTTWNTQLLQNASAIFGGTAIADDGDGDGDGDGESRMSRIEELLRSFCRLRR